MAFEIAFTTLFDSNTLVTSGLIWHVDAGNVASYPGTGTVWTDLVAGANANLVGSPVFNAADGGTFELDAFNDAADASKSIASTSGTISLWIRPPTAGTRRNFFVAYDGSAGISWSHNVGVSATNTIAADMFDGGTKSAAGTTVMTADTWHYITMVWVNSSAMTLYLDNISTAEDSIGIATSWTGNTSISVGRGSGGGWSSALGRVSMCHIYNRNLSTSEIAQNYNATKTRFGL